MAGAQEPLEPQLVLLDREIQLFRAEMQQLARKIEQILGVTHNSMLLSDQQGRQHREMPTPILPRLLGKTSHGIVMQMGCHEQASFAHGIFGA